MKLYRYFNAIIILLLVFSIDIVNAESCDVDDTKRLKVLANNVEITYEYNDDIYDNEGFKVYDTYKIVINNLTDELYVVEGKTDTNFSNYAIKDGAIVIDSMYSGKRTFKIYSKTCDRVLKTYYITLPKFNYYSTDPVCEGKEDLEVCQKFYDTSNIDDIEFYDLVMKSDNKDGNDNIDDDFNKSLFSICLDFVKDNYLFFSIGGGLMLILVVVIFVLRHKKRGVLE